jgi:hypothetical protein
MEPQWVQVRNCRWVHEAQFFKSVLDAAGIDALIPDEHTLSVQSLYVTALGGVRLMVRPEDLERAEEVLSSAAMNADSEPESDGPPRGPETRDE